jgi:hypothetical protein
MSTPSSDVPLITPIIFFEINFVKISKSKITFLNLNKIIILSAIIAINKAILIKLIFLML